MLLGVCAFGSLSRPYAHKDADFAAGPFVTDGFIEGHGGWVVFAGTFIEEDGLSDLDGLECQGSRGCGSAGLPYCGVGFDGGFFAGIVGAEQDLASARFPCAFVHGRDGAVKVSRLKYCSCMIHSRLSALFPVVV